MAEYYDYRDHQSGMPVRAEQQVQSDETRADRLRRFAEPQPANEASDERNAERVDRLRQYTDRDPETAGVHRDERPSEQAATPEERYEHSIGPRESPWLGHTW